MFLDLINTIFSNEYQGIRKLITQNIGETMFLLALIILILIFLIVALIKMIKSLFSSKKIHVVLENSNTKTKSYREQLQPKLRNHRGLYWTSEGYPLCPMCNIQMHPFEGTHQNNLFKIVEHSYFECPRCPYRKNFFEKDKLLSVSSLIESMKEN